MGHKVTTLLDAQSGTGAGSSVKLGDGDTIHTAAVLVRGITIATVQVQVSADGTNWGSAARLDGARVGNISGNGVRVLAGNAPYIRGNVTAHTIGTITMSLVYLD